MATGICIPIFEDGEKISGHVAAPVSGKTFYKIAGDRQGGSSLAVSDDVSGRNYECATAGNGDKVTGVFEYDAPADSKVGLINSPGIIVPVTAGAAIAAGQEVQSDANGKAIPLAAGKAAGYCMTGAAAGDDAEIKLY